MAQPWLAPVAAVELVDHLIPRADRGRRPTTSLERRDLKVVELDALLLDPGEIAEVEYPVPFDGAHLQGVGGVDVLQSAARRPLRLRARRTRREVFDITFSRSEL